MKKKLLIVAWLIFMAGLTQAQVIADFETGANGFAASDWGNMLNDEASGMVADPSGRTAGAMKISLTANNDGNEKAALANGSIGSFDGKVVSYDLWLPANTPDDLLFKIFSQTTDNWNWKSTSVLAGTLDKEQWVKVYLDLEYWSANGADYTQIKKFGIEFNLQGAADSNKSWSGDIYVDNVNLLGALPTVYADFETGTNGFAASDWGNMLNDDASGMVADPSGRTAGAMKISLTANNDGNEKAALANGSIGSFDGKVVSYDLWLPADTPDDLLFKIFSQTTDNWNWKSTSVLAGTLDKEQWVKVYLDLEYWSANGADYTQIKKFGIEFNLQGAADSNKSWSGDIYVDNILGLNTETATKWLLSDWENELGGTDGFAEAGWAPAGAGLSWATDLSGISAGVLKQDVAFTAENHKVYSSRGGINLYNAVTEETANKLTLDLFLPADFSLDAQISMTIQAADGGWLENPYLTDTSTTLTFGAWNTLEFDLTKHYGDSLDISQLIDPIKVHTFGLQVWDRTSAATYSGSLLYDNLTLVGISAPDGELTAPSLIAEVVDTVVVANGINVHTVRFDWVDNTIGTETYNIYMSNSPIASLDAEGVIKIHSGIPHGLEKYAHRPWTNDGGVYDYYYALTAEDGGVETELSEAGKVGPISIKTSTTMKVKYVADFANSFSLDGLDTEFTDYKVNQMEPETVGGTYAAEWTPESTDLYYKTTMVIDDNYLYISADVTDDDLRTDEDMQAWEGDALEFYFGFYDAMAIDAWHGKNYLSSNGDWRIGFTARGEVALRGGSGSADAIPGVEATVFQKFTGDGYIIEARLSLDSLAADGENFEVYNGMMMPMRIDNNDWDPQNGDDSRSLTLHAGGNPTADDIDMNEGWLRPHTWGFLEVIGIPSAVENLGSGLPEVYKLYNNYPNPFNPSTTIKYDLPEQSEVSLRVYDVLGREVATLVNSKQQAGSYEYNFDANNLSSGMYIYEIVAGSFTKTAKMMLLK